MWNLRKVNGVSPWDVRRKDDPSIGGFKVTLIPFGALVDFRPPANTFKGLPKFASRAMPGIFLGYRLQPGGIWKGEY